MADTFFDIHMHAMDLSHPNLIAFLQRVNGIAGKLLLGGIAEPFLGQKEERLINLLTVMENNIGDYFILMEHFLKNKPPMVVNDGLLKTGEKEFDTILLTPLIMDFGFKDIKSKTFYDMALGKPVVCQTKDVLDAIKKYCNCEFAVKTGNKNHQEGITVPRKSRPIFEIYPFLGINPAIYDLPALTELLDRCFSGYTGKRVDLHANMGTFGGDISNIGSNIFAGIKLYPPLGFDPWPVGDKEQMDKVNYLYNMCQNMQVPITVHCSDGGFVTVDNAHDLTNPVKWEQVLIEYPKLKLNLAHFGHQGNFLGIIHRHEWLEKIIQLVAYDNVYTDISCLAFDDAFYEDFAEVLKKNSKLINKVLFGSDYLINLQWIGSYNEYLRAFQSTDKLSEEQKFKICSTNPEKFLFHSK